MMKQIPRDLEGEYTIRVVDMPDGSNGCVILDAEEHANIYINARLSYEEQRKAAEHEMRHIINDDFYNCEPLAVIEARADGVDPKLKAVPKLVKARDLVPPPELEPVPEPKQEPPKLTPRQSVVIMTAISELDRCFFNNDF